MVVLIVVILAWRAKEDDMNLNLNLDSEPLAVVATFAPIIIIPYALRDGRLN